MPEFGCILQTYISQMLIYYLILLHTCFFILIVYWPMNIYTNLSYFIYHESEYICYCLEFNYNSFEVWKIRQWALYAGNITLTLWETLSISHSVVKYIMKCLPTATKAII